MKFWHYTTTGILFLSASTLPLVVDELQLFRSLGIPNWLEYTYQAHIFRFVICIVWCGLRCIFIRFALCALCQNGCNQIVFRCHCCPVRLSFARYDSQDWDFHNSKDSFPPQSCRDKIIFSSSYYYDANSFPPHCCDNSISSRFSIHLCQ